MLFPRRPSHKTIRFSLDSIASASLVAAISQAEDQHQKNREEASDNEPEIMWHDLGSPEIKDRPRWIGTPLSWLMPVTASGLMVPGLSIAAG